MRSADNRHLAWLLALVFAVGTLTLPAELYEGDSKLWREEARSLVLDGDFTIAPELAERDGIRGQYYVRNPRDGLWYSKYGIVNGLMNAIPLAVERMLTGELPPWKSTHRALILGLFFALLSVVLAAVLFQVARHYTANNAAIAVFVLLCFFTTYVWNYLRLTTSESSQALMLAVFFLFFLRYKRRAEPLAQRPLGNLHAAWLALAVLCHIRFSYLLYLPLFALACLWLAWREPPPRAQRWPLLRKAILVPAVLIVAAQAAVHYVKFGSPLLSGYHESSDAPFPHTLGMVLYDFLISPQWSLLINFPPILLALAGARRFFREHADEALLLLAFLLLTFAIVAPLPFWRGEWAYGPRYFVFIMPLLALPALYPLEWALTRGGGTTPARLAFCAGIAAASLCLVLIQLQVLRSYSFQRYWAGYLLHADRVAAVERYLGGTHYARINLDLLRCAGNWRCLSFAAELPRAISAQELARTEQRLPAMVSFSNLLWFPELNRPKP